MTENIEVNRDQVRESLGKRPVWMDILFSSPCGELFAALAKAQQKMKPVHKNQKGQLGHRIFDYADLNALRDEVTPALTEQEIAILQQIIHSPSGHYLVTTLGHSSGQWGRCYLKLRQIDDDREFGSHITYMRRYSLAAITNQSQTDDDGATATQDVITDDQVETLTKMLNKRDTNMTKFTTWLKLAIGVEELKQVPQHRFDEVVTAINSKPVKKEAKTNDNT